MKLAKVVSVFLKENKYKHLSWKQDHNFIVDVSCVIILASPRFCHSLPIDNPELLINGTYI